jgi:hypothetical protein
MLVDCWHDNVDCKILVCFADVSITIAYASEF